MKTTCNTGVNSAPSFPAAFGVAGFCFAHGMSRATYYNLKKDGLAPAEMRVRGRVLISAEAAEAWRRRMEAATEGETL